MSSKEFFEIKMGGDAGNYHVIPDNYEEIEELRVLVEGQNHRLHFPEVESDEISSLKDTIFNLPTLQQAIIFGVSSLPVVDLNLLFNGLESTAQGKQIIEEEVMTALSILEEIGLIVSGGVRDYWEIEDDYELGVISAVRRTVELAQDQYRLEPKVRSVLRIIAGKLG